MRTLRIPVGRVTAVAFAADGRLMVGDAGGTVWLYDSLGGRCRSLMTVTMFPLPYEASARVGRVANLADTGAGGVVATTPSGNPCLYDLAADRELPTLSLRSAERLNGVVVSQGGRYLAGTDAETHMVTVYPLALSGSATYFEDAGESPLLAFAGGRHLVVVPRTWPTRVSLTVWDVESGSRAGDWPDTPSRPAAAAGCPRGAAVALAYAQHAEVRALPGGAKFATVSHETTQRHTPVRRLAFHPSGRLLATAGDGPALSVWDLPSGRAVAVYDTGFKRVTCLAFAGDGLTLAAGSGGRKIAVFDIEV